MYYYVGASKAPEVLMDERPRFRRRHFLINKGLQYRFVGGFTLAVLGGLLVNLYLAYFLIDRELAQELYKIHIRIGTTSEVAFPILAKLGAVTIPLILASAAAVGFVLTRRIEAPLLRFREAVRRTSGGDFTQDLPDRIPGDLPEAFKSMSRSLEAVFSSVKKSTATLELGVAALKGAPSSAELRGALGAVAEARERISQELSKLKV